MSNIMDDETQSVRLFGQAVRAAREERGLSLADLERSAGVSRSMLSKIERGEASPTLPIASRIARGLGIGLSQLLGAAPATDTLVVTRRDERLAFRDPSGFVRELLSPPLEGRGVEIARHVIPSGGSSGELAPYAAGTRKFVVIENGRLDLRAGQSVAALEAGDAACFEADVSHTFSNSLDRPCSYLLVISRAN